ncbi:signal recognition particle 14 kDa protein, putative [Entamoeba invadens IP1]|uniref:signal recognition particle 14 kDa protein, putative n=1 Tax=Entamoeba invadens IP1 TaxID=370355 RepID=UPI0002C3D2AD|nr:signal recognition particle 14 kDa protein, putative [Entamoeba invadens IP1]ELP94259.1 signal recognition particle 14 kDa protein, putative [Entamoeba invadens IP1]|eukprot:XP_004261030.1 signal recognition particle 14 kDa protein, putative [Entamoeba invadens IP1]
MSLLENDAFLEELTKLYKLSKTKKSGSVWVTFKQYRHIDKPKKSKKDAEQEEKPSEQVLLRATNGSKKISTIVKKKEVGKFNQKLRDVMGSEFNLKRDH